MPPALEADTSFETHEWKSEFASSRSGRNSPNIFAKVRRKLLLTPPVRNARSPRLTEEELDALTGDLPYATNYTYAYSKIYDPSLPDHWEVPNLGGVSSVTLSEQEHYSAASLTRQLFYVLRFPIFLVLHVITYILEAFYHVIKISSYTFWEYLVYLIKQAKTRYEIYQDNRRRTAFIRNRQDPFSVKAGRFLRSFAEIIVFVFLLPVRMFTGKKEGVEQYDYKSIKTQLESDRASRMMTRSQAQTIDRSRKFEGLSQSPSRRTPARTSTTTTVTAKVFASGATPSTSTVTTRTRTVKERSVTPRFRGTRSSVHHLETPEADTPLSTYGLRSRGRSTVNTPEPTFDIGNVAATSTPLFASNLESFEVPASQGGFNTMAHYLFYFLISPFLLFCFIGNSFYDYATSLYMRIVDYQEEPLEPINVRDEGEPAILEAPILIFLPFSRRILAALWNYSTRVSRFVKRSVSIAIVSTVNFVSSVVNSIYGLGCSALDAVGEKLIRSKRLNYLNCLFILLALIFALLLASFITSENTFIRARQINFTDRAETPQMDNTIPIPRIPAYVTIAKYVTHYAWMIKEFAIDLAFDAYNALQPLGAKISTVPSYIYSSGEQAAGSVSLFLTGAIGSVGETAKSSSAYVSNVISVSTPSFEGIGQKSFGFVSDSYNAAAKLFKYIVLGVTDTIEAVIRSTFNFIFGIYKGAVDGLQYVLVNLILNPLDASVTYLENHYNALFVQPFKTAARAVFNGLYVVLEYAYWLFESFRSAVLFVVTLPVQIMSQIWLYANNLTAEDMMRREPPVDIHPTMQTMETLRKATEVEDEKLVIVPSPAPAPIPIPNQPPVIIQQTNVVETVDKEAIVKEVTEKLRAELSAQFHQELTTKFEQNYNTIIEKLKVENTHIQIDNAHLEGLIRQLIYEYDTDKTGQVDYALESSGGAVVSTRCSETYKSYTRLEKFWDIPIYYHHYSPRVVIQRNSKSLFPGECWCFKESRGYIAVELSHFIDVSSISYEHIGKEVAPEGNRSSAPKNVLVWAYRQIDDLNTRVLLGDYTYNLEEPPLQFFIAKHKPDFPVKFVELEVTSNYGAEFTCLYRLRVHGKMVKV